MARANYAPEPTDRAAVRKTAPHAGHLHNPAGAKNLKRYLGLRGKDLNRALYGTSQRPRVVKLRFDPRRIPASIAGLIGSKRLATPSKVLSAA
jgi:hypothetical protein